MNNIETEKSVEVVLKNSYPLQRLFLNNQNEKITIQQIQEVWPCLLKKTILFLHFTILTKQSIPDIMKRLNDDILRLLSICKIKKLHRY